LVLKAEAEEAVVEDAAAAAEEDAEEVEEEAGEEEAVEEEEETISIALIMLITPTPTYGHLILAVTQTTNGTASPMNRNSEYLSSETLPETPTTAM
jgi:hypothetical protein